MQNNPNRIAEKDHLCLQHPLYKQSFWAMLQVSCSTLQLSGSVMLSSWANISRGKGYCTKEAQVFWTEGWQTPNLNLQKQCWSSTLLKNASASMEHRLWCAQSTVVMWISNMLVFRGTFFSIKARFEFWKKTCLHNHRYWLLSRLCYNCWRSDKLFMMKLMLHARLIFGAIQTVLPCRGVNIAPAPGVVTSLLGSPLKSGACCSEFMLPVLSLAESPLEMESL